MNLIRRTLIAATMAATCVLSASVVHASTYTYTVVRAGYSKAKTIQFSIRNDSGSPLELRAGDSIIKVEAGKTVSINLPIGTRIITSTETSKHKSGDLIAEVSSALKDATIAIN